MRFMIVFAILLAVLSFTVGCGGGSGEKAGSASQQSAKTPGGELTEWELEHGIGPIKEKVQLGPIDKKLADKGKAIFETKCTPCHKLDQRHIGPALREVTKRRTPEFIMNQILNPDENVKKHPEGKKMLAEYLTPMTFMNVTKDDARALLEFLRLEGEKAPESK